MLMDLVRRLRYSGYLDQIGITEREPGEVFEKLIDHLASTHDWSRTARSNERVRGAKKGSKKATKKPAKKPSKSRKKNRSLPEAEEITSHPANLHYIVDPLNFLDT